mgnify:CR=1 FL=1
MRITKDISEIKNFLPVIALPDYLKLQSADFGYFVSEKKIIIPFAAISRLGLKWLVLTASPLNSNDINKEKLLVNEIIHYARKQNYVYITCANHALFDFYPQGSRHCVFGTYKVNLELTEKELFKNLHTKHRNVIRKAEKDGVNILHGKEFRKECISIIIETQARQGIKSSFSHFNKLHSLNENIEFWIAKDEENNTQGSAIFFWNKNHSCYYMYGGSSASHHTGALNLLQWKAMLYMKEQSVKYFDFVGARINPPKGSKYEGIQLFKSRFGSTLHKGYLFKIILSPRYYFLNFLLNVNSLLKYRKRHKGDMIDQEMKRGNVEL